MLIWSLLRPRPRLEFRRADSRRDLRRPARRHHSRELLASSGTAFCRPASRWSTIATRPAARRATRFSPASSPDSSPACWRWSPAPGRRWRCARVRDRVGRRARAAVLRPERRALGLRRARAAGRVQPEAAVAQRHDRDRVHRALRADFRLRVRQHLGRTFAPGARLRGGRLVPRRAPGLPAAARDACR